MQNSDPVQIMTFIQSAKETLGLNEIHIELKETQGQYYEANINQGVDANHWVITYNSDIYLYYFLHELGHIYLSRKLNFIAFARQTPYTPRIHRDIPKMLNNLLDGFVDYHLSLIPSNYSIIRERNLDYLIQLDLTLDTIKKNWDYIEVMSWYLIWFISFNFILNSQDKSDYSNQIKEVLAFTRLHLLTFKGKCSANQFKRVIKILNSFNDIKSTQDPTVIIKYCADLVIAIGYWGTPLITEQLELFFQCIMNTDGTITIND